MKRICHKLSKHFLKIKNTHSSSFMNVPYVINYVLALFNYNRIALMSESSKTWVHGLCTRKYF